MGPLKEQTKQGKSQPRSRDTRGSLVWASKGRTLFLTYLKKKEEASSSISGGREEAESFKEKPKCFAESGPHSPASDTTWMEHQRPQIWCAEELVAVVGQQLPKLLTWCFWHCHLQVTSGCQHYWPVLSDTLNRWLALCVWVLGTNSKLSQVCGHAKGLQLW